MIRQTRLSVVVVALGMFPRKRRKTVPDKDMWATRLGATGLRGPEREICLERVSERESLQRF